VPRQAKAKVGTKHFFSFCIPFATVSGHKIDRTMKEQEEGHVRERFF
jgi:hypothetical protein